MHNEYGRCFGERANIVNPRNLKLPFWLFNFEEIVDIIFGGRPALDEEVEILAEVIPLAKAGYTQYRGGPERMAIKRLDAKNVGYTVDTPVPYRLADLLAQIDERMGKLENRSTRLVYHKLMTRIEAVSNDPRYSFMFENANVGGDTMAEALSQLFRVPAHGKPLTVLQLAGFPAEVVDAVVSVLCRMAFDFGLWSDGASPMLLMCEKAHHYAAADRSVGFGPTRRAISRLAKEGRKYGVFLGLVTQRPAELDPTIISQCSTLFAMRMSNDRDQALLRSAVSDHAANLFAFVPDARHARSGRIQRRRAVADPVDVRRAAAAYAAAQRLLRQGFRPESGRRGCELHFGGGRALARRDDEGRRRRSLARSEAGRRGRAGSAPSRSGAGAGRSAHRAGGRQPVQPAEETARGAARFARLVARRAAGRPSTALARQIIIAFGRTAPQRRGIVRYGLQPTHCVPLPRTELALFQRRRSEPSRSRQHRRTRPTNHA